jgi:plastocyanin
MTRPARRLLLLALVLVAAGAAVLLQAGGAAVAQTKAAGAEIDGTAANRWQPATVTIKPGQSVTFKIAGGPPHPVGSGTAPPGDKKFDTSACQLATMSKVGASCTVKFNQEGTFPFFCEVHFALGMTGTITVSKSGAAAGGATSTSSKPS